METASIILEYLKVILSIQMVCGIVAITFICLFGEEVKSLLKRIATIKIGPAVVSAPQPKAAINEPNNLTTTDDIELPQGNNNSDQQAAIEVLKQAWRAEKARAHLWEYRYLNYFFVPNTQQVLDWIKTIESPPTFTMYDAWWNPVIATAKERRAIINVLEEHNLVVIENDVIQITPKGKEYIEWRGGQYAQQ